MTRIIEVEYRVHVYAEVDLDTGKVVRVVSDDENIQPTGQYDVQGEAHVDAEDVDRAQQIADDAEWPVWTRGY